MLVLLHTNYPISDVVINYSVLALKEWHRKARAESRNMFRAPGPKAETWDFRVPRSYVRKTVLRGKAAQFKAGGFSALRISDGFIRSN